MSNALNIARAELLRIFLSPLAWAVLAVVQLILGFFFGIILYEYWSNPPDDYGVSAYVISQVYGTATLVVLLVMPLMTMRLFAEERKSGSITLLFSAPVSLIEVVLGKFLGLLGFIAAMILLLALMPLSLSWTTHLDWGLIGGGLAGLFLLMTAFGAAGLFISSLTREPTIAAVGSFGLLLFVWVIGALSYNEEIPMHDLINYLSLITHYDSMRRGMFNTADAVYYALFTSLFLWLTVQRLDMERN